MKTITSANGKAWAILRKPRGNADDVSTATTATSWLIPYGVRKWDLYQKGEGAGLMSVGFMSTNDQENVRKIVELMSQEHVP